MITGKTESSAQLASRPRLMVALVFLLAITAASNLIWNLEQHRLMGERARVASVADDYANNLQRYLDQTFSATYALAALVRQGHGAIADFDAVAHEMLTFYPGVSALGLAPRGVVQAIIPLAGNEGAIGHDMLGDPARSKESLLARDTEKLTLAGPFDLVQGGMGAVARLPVFMENEQGKPAFWGFTTVLIRFPKVLDGALLSQLVGRGFGYELWRIHPDSGKKQVIATSASFPLAATVEHPIQVPNGAWTLSMAPVKGWGDPVGLALKSALGLLFSLLLAWLTKLLVESKSYEARLEALVAERTVDLEKSDKSLRNELDARKLAEESLQAQKKFTEKLIENSAAATFVLDPQHKVILWNRACEELTGIAAATMIDTGDHWQAFYDHKRPCLSDVVLDADYEGLPSLYGSFAKSTLVPNGLHAEGWYKNLNGKDRYILFDAAPVYDGKGRLLAAIETLNEITEHRKLEAQFNHAQKMESIGTLAGGIAHDFNNILAAIIGYGQFTLMKMPADDLLRHNIESMLEAADRAAHLTKELLLFSRKQAIDRKPLDLNLVVAKVEKFLKKVIGEDISCQTILHEEQLSVFADAYQLEQVLMNLAINARDSMPQGGSLTVTTAYITLDGEFVSVHGFGKPGAYALINVSDTGMGMDQATQQRIFEPFFTTKEVGKGTGLGLAVAYGIIKQHDGFINVYSEPGKGTAFRIYLPLIAAAVEEESLTGQDRSVVGGTETILLSEDDEAVRIMTKKLLTEFGYTVIVAVDGADAVNSFKENSQAMDLLLLDLIMPRMNGKEAFDEIRKIRPGIKALFYSGYAPDTIRQKASLAEGTHLIAKPASPIELLRKIRSVLDGEPIN